MSSLVSVVVSITVTIVPFTCQALSVLHIFTDLTLKIPIKSRTVVQFID